MSTAGGFASLASLPWLRRAVPWVGGLFIGVIVAMAAYDIIKTYRATVSETGRQLETQAQIIAEQTARSLQAVDILLRHLARQYQQGAFASLGQQGLHTYLREQAVGLVQIEGLLVIDASGTILAMAEYFPSPRHVTEIAEPSSFEALKNAKGDRLLVGSAMLGADRQWLFPLARRIETPAGEFGGAVGARGRIPYYQDFYRALHLGAGTSTSLMHRNGTLLARYPTADAALGKRFALFDDVLASRERGEPAPTRTASPIDGVERFGAIAPVTGYPLHVLVTRDTAVALAPWRQQALGTVARTLALATLAVLLLAVVMRQLARLDTARASLEVAQERFVAAVAGSDDGIWDWDRRNRRMFASARAREILGLAPGPEVQAADAWPALVAFHPEDAPKHRAALRDHLASRTPAYEGEYRVRQQDGRYRWVRIRGVCVRNARGRPQRMAGSVSDIDGRKRAEDALRVSEDRYAIAMSGSNEGHWVWNVVTDEFYASPMLKELFLIPPEVEITTRTELLSRLAFHPDDRERVKRTVADHLEGRSARLDLEYRIIDAAGGVHWIYSRAQCFRDADGKPLRMAGATVQVTERKRAEEDRDRLEAQLRQAQKLEAIGTLAGGIAHDFNNILAAILGYGEMAQKDAAEGTRLRRHIDAALSAGLRAKSLVERILAFSRSGMGERVPVHVQAVVAEALDLLAASLPPEVGLERRLVAHDAAVLGDPAQVHQVVMNLCTNAIQSMKSRGTLTVSLEPVDMPGTTVATSVLKAGRYIRLQVRDTGSGIAPQVRERMFDPFFTTKGVGVGTGLGLSLVHGIVTDLGGGIDVESRVGHGSLFTVYLPRERHVEAPAISEAPVAPGNGETILIVDDEEALVRLGEEMLAELGYEPIGCTSSIAALRMLRDEPSRFDVVLSDESMPEMTGSELALEIRRVRPDLPILLMSGYVNAALLARASQAGVRDVLSKPLASRDIAKSLAAVLSSQAAASVRAVS